MHPVTSFLKTHGIRLNTDLGQHFLIDDDVLQAIVASAGIEPEDHIVEIGPGIGVLTKELLKHAGKVTAIEIDPRMISLVKKFVKEFVGQEYSCPTNSLTNFLTSEIILGSISIAVTFPACFKSSFVSTPIPGPISTM